MTETLKATHVVTDPKHPCRGSYVNVFQPRKNELSGKEEYSMQLLIPKDAKDTLAKIREAMAVALHDKFGDKQPANPRNPLRDGDAEHPGEKAYAGMYFINVKNSQKPQVVDQNRQHVMDPEMFRSGDWCCVHINAFGYDQKGNKGVSFGLNSIQIVRKGEPLDGRVDAEAVFGTVEAEDQDAGAEGADDPFA